MASTTLVTFMMQAPRSIVNVELFGSWDNFRKPYPMKPDLRMGHGHWRGCHSFTDIICDGDTVLPADGRDGGLKMGGLYWYFYQLNGYIDYHNSAEPSTTSCPFLPGQVLNILEVPTQTDTRGRRGSTSSLLSTLFTLNPEDKYLNPRPPAQDTPHEHKVSINLEDSLVHEDDRDGEEPAIFNLLDADRLLESLNALVPQCGYDFASQNSLGLLTRSKPISRQSHTSLDLGEPRHIQSAGEASFGHGNNKRPSTRNGWLEDSFDKFMPSVSTSNSPRPMVVSVPNLNAIHDTYPAIEGPSDAMISHDYLSEDFEDLSPLKGKLDPLSMILDGWDITYPMEYYDPNAHRHRLSTMEDSTTTLKLDPMNFELPCHIREPRTRSDEVSPMYTDNDNIDDTRWHNSSSVYSSVRSSQMISPSLSCSTAWTGCISPVHLGQPSTPQNRDFEDLDLKSKRPSGSLQPSGLSHEDHEGRVSTELPSACRFSGYSLPEADYTSALTLRNLAPVMPQNPSANSPFRQGIGHERVESWNDGAPFEDVLHDLSYLGGVIV